MQASYNLYVLYVKKGNKINITGIEINQKRVAQGNAPVV